MTSLNDEGAALARAKRLLASIKGLLGGTDFVVTSTRTLSGAMVPALERLEALASRYWENLLAEGPAHDAASLLDEVGLILERRPRAPHGDALDFMNAFLGQDSSEEAMPDDSGPNDPLPGSVKISLERARESIQRLESEVASLTSEVTSAVERLDARLHMMLTGPRPQAWAGTAEGFELQVLLLLELRFARYLRFDGAHMNHLQELWHSFLRPGFPHCGCRPLSAITDDFAVVRRSLRYFDASLRKRFGQNTIRSSFGGFASAAG